MSVNTRADSRHASLTPASEHARAPPPTRSSRNNRFSSRPRPLPEAASSPARPLGASRRLPLHVRAGHTQSYSLGRPLARLTSSQWEHGGRRPLGRHHRPSSHVCRYVHDAAARLVPRVLTASPSVGCALHRTGQQLLQRLGWKAGHGIGPRRLRAVQTDDADLGNGDLYLLPPTDTAIIDIVPKDNVFGIGFDALKHAPEFAGA